MGHNWLEAKSFDLAKRQAKGTSREIAEEKWIDVKADATTVKAAKGNKTGNSRCCHTQVEKQEHKRTVKLKRLRCN